jgi:hypothetical protein
MMRYLGSHRRGYLGSTDIHSAIHLHGIDGHHLATQMPCDFDRYLGFARPGGADDGDCGQETTLPRRWCGAARVTSTLR